HHQGCLVLGKVYYLSDLAATLLKAADCSYTESLIKPKLRPFPRLLQLSLNIEKSRSTNEEQAVALGDEVHTLAEVIPNLSQFLRLEPVESGEEQGYASPASQRYL
ncbi:hypothetical protein ACHAWF_015698, partial [Thalassiosira exigua]